MSEPPSCLASYGRHLSPKIRGGGVGVFSTNDGVLCCVVVWYQWAGREGKALTLHHCTAILISNCDPSIPTTLGLDHARFAGQRTRYDFSAFWLPCGNSVRRVRQRRLDLHARSSYNCCPLRWVKSPIDIDKTRIIKFDVVVSSSHPSWEIYDTSRLFLFSLRTVAPSL